MICLWHESQRCIWYSTPKAWKTKAEMNKKNYIKLSLILWKKSPQKQKCNQHIGGSYFHITHRQQLISKIYNNSTTTKPQSTKKLIKRPKYILPQRRLSDAQEKHSTLFIRREMQIKPIRRYHFTLLIIVFLKKTKQHILTRMWRKWNHHSLLVEM